MLPLLRYIEVNHIKDEIRFCETDDINHGVRFKLTMVSQKYSLLRRQIYILVITRKKIYFTLNQDHLYQRHSYQEALCSRPWALDDFWWIWADMKYCFLRGRKYIKIGGVFILKMGKLLHYKICCQIVLILGSFMRVSQCMTKSSHSLVVLEFITSLNTS